MRPDVRMTVRCCGRTVMTVEGDDLVVISREAGRTITFLHLQAGAFRMSASQVVNVMRDGQHFAYLDPSLPRHRDYPTYRFDCPQKGHGGGHRIEAAAVAVLMNAGRRNADVRSVEATVSVRPSSV